MVDLRRRHAVRLLAAGCLCGAGGAAWAQQAQAPRIGRYRVQNATTWMRDLVIESAGDYAVYEILNGPLYGRGTYSFDGQSVRVLTGPFYTMGYRGSSFVQSDGRHRLNLGNTVIAVSSD